MDTYSATWVSHSSIQDFLRCPRLYYLNNVYKDPESGRKISIMKPALALGQVVHDVLESLSVLPVGERLKRPLSERYEQAWIKVAGEKGGFFDSETERRFKERGAAMLRRVYNKPGPLLRKALKIRMDLPHYWLSEEEGIILCGKIDWLEYLPEDDTLHIIDFKTGKKTNHSSLQLPIYLLLVTNLQNRRVTQASYWYLELSDTLEPQDMPELTEAHEEILKIAKRIKLARALEKFDCPETDGCRYCKEHEWVIQGKARHVGVNEINQDMFVLPPQGRDEPEVEIL